MLYRISKNGFFLACSDRECGTTQPVDQQGKPTVREVTEFKCPVCGREMIKRRGRFGEFLGCSGYSVKNEKGEPSCTTIINLDKEGNPLPPKPAPVPTTIKCDKCGEGTLVLRGGKRGPWLGCNRFHKCRGMKSLAKLDEADRKQVEALIPLLNEESAKAQEMVAKIHAANPSAAPSASAPKGPIPTDIDCDECGKPMVIRQGRRGPFLGCSGYPKCKNTGEVPAKLLEEMGLNGKNEQDKTKDIPPISIEPMDHEDAA
jgi:DNA topoisomerase-1